ncbi:MAG: type 1 glutamine amidotransferase, partial [bacterium]|nr:type 1 glutamine amidotransferase [bacterium]MDW8163175.1 type 1 glutamine amidotransferase [Candidatus Omnitrophota bacterium]
YNIPYLGICLGSQLLAKTFGAKVYVGKCKEVGFYEVEITDLGRKDNLFNCIEESFYVFQYHSDCFEIPEKGTLLVKGKDCYINQGFKVDENLYGLQFHIEVEEKLLRNFGIDYDGKLKVLKNTGEKIIKNFLNISFKN